MPWFHYKNNYSQATAFKYAKFTDGEMQEMTAMRLKVEARWHSMPPRRTLNIQTVTAGRPLLILSLDGGGVKGTMTAEIIKRLAEKYPGLLASIDVFAGTSAGSLLATMFAYGYTADEAAYVFEKFVPKLFNYTCFRVAKRIANIYKSKYSNKNLIAAANALFGNATYGDLRKHLVTVSLDLSNPGRKYDPVAHHSFPPQFGERHNPDAMLYFNGFKSVSEACIQSAAAPTFFPTYKGHADGGMFANNPALIATCIVLGQSRDLNRSHIHVLSVSTGHPEPGVTGLHLEGDQKWGVRQWLPNIIDTCMESGNNYTQEMLETLLPPGNLCRIDQLIDPEFVLDAIDKMPEMRSFARTVDLTSACRFLDQLSVGSPAEYARHLLPEACPGHGSLSTFGEFGGSGFGHVQSSNGGFGGGGFGGGQSSNGGFGGGGGGGASTFRFEGFSPVSLHP